MSSLLLSALKYLLITVAVVCLAWLAVCIVATLTGHTDSLPAIGAVLADLIETLVTRPLHDLATMGPSRGCGCPR